MSFRKIQRLFCNVLPARDVIECDVAIVGAGPSGLSSAIRMKQLKPDLEVVMIEKGAEVGAHILSGNVFETKAMDELLPNWRDMDSPIKTPALEDKFYVLTEKKAYTVPHFLLPKTLHNKGNYIISLSDVCKWLGEQAEELGVEIYPGFAANEILYNEAGYVEGVATGDMGIGKDGSQTENYTRGIEIKAKQTLFAEGCRGFLGEQLIKNFKLREFKHDGNQVTNQTYALGVKEIWKVPDHKFKRGFIQHSVGWPLGMKNGGGTFLYHKDDNEVHVGMVVALDYKNPYLSPYKELQRSKLHPSIKTHLEGGECISYGARTINEGGYYAIPKLTFPGGVLAGCSAGFLNVPKIKGSHNAIKSGMVAAEEIVKVLDRDDSPGQEVYQYYTALKESWLWKELYATRGARDGFHYGLIPGLINSWFCINLLRGGSLLKSKVKPDSETTGYAKDFKPIDYPKPDGVLTFDLLTNLSRSGTNHEANQPAHLRIKPGQEETAKEYSNKLYGGPEQHFCPAGVYEYDDQQNLVINAQNCVHCKTCDIKTPGEYIHWTCPEGSGGPNYYGM